MKTTTFNVCTWILLASLVLSVSARAKSAHKCAEAVDSNSGNGVPGQHRMSIAGSIAEKTKVAHGLKNGSPDFHVRQFDPIIDGSEIIENINSEKKLNAANSVIKKNNLNKRVFRQQRYIYDEKKFKGVFSLVAVSENTTSSNINQSNTNTVKKSEILKSDDEITPDDLALAKRTMMFDKRKSVVVYSDGSIIKRSDNGTSAGAGVWFGVQHILNLSEKVPDQQTKHSAELYAALRAIERAKMAGINKIHIHTDSHFIKKCAKSLVIMLKKNIDAKALKLKGLKLSNTPMLVKLRQAIKSVKLVQWTYIPGFNSVLGNLEAERLAYDAAKLNVPVTVKRLI